MASSDATKKIDPPRPAPRPVPVRPRVGPFDFLQQVRDEGRKVTWPSRKETTITTIMVFVMVVVASVFFTVVDQVLRFAVGVVLGIGA